MIKMSERSFPAGWSAAILVAIALVLTPTLQAQEGTLIETFDDPGLPGWDRAPGVTVVNGVLRVEAENYASHPGAWGDIHLRVRARLTGEGLLAISYRVSDAGDYTVQIGPDVVLLLRAEEELFVVPHDIPVDEWLQIEIFSLGEIQEVVLNGEPMLSIPDPAPLTAGGIALKVIGGASGEFDDLIVEPLGETPPQPEEDQAPAQPAEDASPPSVNGLTWIRTGGPPGGIGYDIRYNFDDPDIWYVTDNFAGVHISTDRGLTWLPSNTGIPGQLGPTGDWTPVFSLTVDPHNPQIIWAGTDKTGHIYKSMDAGHTWAQKDNGVAVQTEVYDALTFRGFTIDPGTSDIVYAMGETEDQAAGGALVWSNAVGGVVYKTTDGGENWELVWDGGIPSSLARYMWINPQNTDILYVSTGIFDRGAINEGDPNTDTYPFGGLGILKSADGGESWRVLDEDNGLDFLYVSSLYMHPDDPDILLAATGKGEPDLYLDYQRENNLPNRMGIYRTTDGGETWTQVLADGGFTAVELCPSDPNIAYAASAHVVYRSDDAGLTWTKVAGRDAGGGWGPPGVLAGVPIDLQCDPQDTNRLFANNYLGGNFLSEDGGVTWQNASDGYTGAQILSLAVDPQNAAQVYVAGRNGIWASSDGGSTWYGLRNPPPDQPVWGGEWGGIVVDPTDSQHLLVSEETLWETFDGGASWEVRRSPAFALAATIVFAPSNPQIVYTGRAEPICLLHMEAVCTDGSGVYVSHDGGATWDFANDPNVADLALIDLAVDPHDAQIVYIATERGLFNTNDGGATWVLMGGLPTETRVGAVAVHPQDSRTLLVGIERHGLYHSTDGGETWQAIAAGLQPNSSIRDILYDPADPRIVYLTDLMSGVYRSTDGGQIWAQINAGLTTRSATGLAISSDGEVVYVATNGEGVFRLDVNGVLPQTKGDADSVPQPVQEDPVELPDASPEGPLGLVIALGVISVFVVAGSAWLIFARRKRERTL